MNHKQHLLHSASTAEGAKADPTLLSVPGFTSYKIRKFLNQLCSTGLPYLEVGTYLGATLSSAMIGNPGPFYAVDDFSEFNEGQNELLFWMNLTRLGLQEKVTFFNQSCFTLELAKILHPIEIYFYDGFHNEECQYKALTYMLPAMASTFIYLVDDWSTLPEYSEQVQRGTFRAIKDLGLREDLFLDLGSTKRDDENNWACGFGAFVLTRS